MRHIIGSIAIAVATSLVGAVALAHAAPPVRERVAIDFTVTFDDCGLVVEEHAVGTLHFISWYDASGNRQRELVAAPGAHITWTNPATGASVTTANTFVVHKQDNPGGSVTVAFTGLVFAIQGGGRAYVESGRDVVVFSAGGVDVLSSSGPSADLCEALVAAIG